MALPATEDFNTANDPLSDATGWTTLPVVSDPGKAEDGLYEDESGNSNDKGAYWDADTFADGQYSQIVASSVVTTGGTRLGLVVRASTSTNVATLMRYKGNGDCEAYVWDSGGSRNALSGNPFTPSATVGVGDILRIEIDDATDTLTLKIDYGAGFVTENTWDASSGNTSGQAGIYIVSPNATVMAGDDWEGGDLAAAESAALTGTMTATVDEDDITAGGKTIIVTITGDTFKTAGTGPIGSTADTQALIDGFDAASSPTNGWNNEVRDKASTTEVVRTSSTVATWTVAAQAGYDVSAQEVITGTIPTAVLVTGAGTIVATPTFTIDEVATGRIMGSIAGPGGLAGIGGLAGKRGGMAG